MGIAINMKTLYKLTSTGKIQEWTITYEAHALPNPYYEVVYGQKEGKKVTNKVNILAGKNIGRSNETTAAEQCIVEATALWVKQKDRKGYSESIPTDKPLRPMLAKKYQDHKSKIIFPCYTQFKFDGIRCLASNAKLFTRSNKELNSLPHISGSLSECPYILDGELYSKELDFQEIISAIKRDQPKRESHYVSYYVYDIVDESKTFEERKDILESIKGHYDNIVIVNSKLCNTENEVVEHFEEAVTSGYEGLMLRNKAGLYKINGRSSDLQKYKEFIDKEFLVVDVIPSDKRPEQGIYVCEHKGKTFSATPKCSHPAKEQLLLNRRSVIGKQLTVRFFEWTTSDHPLPRFPVGIAIRDYE